ncbi:TPA: DUF4365 domain-containing protein [Klebsiella michiganensis]|nr:DUF4365 domain-containing protein [Klebsiella michiganensis]
MDDNAYPQRHHSHVTDSIAKRMLRLFIPPEWILRELSENDYGIDFQLEFTSPGNQVTGQIVGIQLKGTSTGNMSNQGSHSVSVKRSTLRLWRSYEAPVLIVLVDTVSGMIYSKSIEREIRRDPDRYILSNSESLSFTFTSADLLTKEKAFNDYQNGKILRRMDHDLPSVIQVHRDFVKLFWRYGREEHMPVDGDGTFDLENFGKHKYERQLRGVYSRMQKLSYFLGLSWNVLTVEAVIRNEKWNSYDGNEMMEHHFTSILDRLDIQFQDILALVQKIVVAYKRFWEMADPELVNFALNPCPMLSKLTWNERRKYLGD